MKSSRTAGVAVAAISMLILAGCASSGEEPTDNGTEPAAELSSEAQAAKDIVDAASVSVEEFTAPGPVFDGTGGHLVVARSHPIRFAVERSEAEHIPLAVAYRASSPFTYPATWGTGTVTHRTFTFRETLQPALNAGFLLDEIDEPLPTRQLREISPERAAWMDSHVGIIIYRFRKPLDGR
ncbi:hypothetical protein BKA24_000420 [Microbacterium marinum]|uniref:Lipoprotein n=1 Tax=Microbacterium marinum TaxID=421115 RepID=A0A7W7BN46_9MICO|nr:hypothetical protein [Microbacterium marinum]MBB4665711.1 hypothetical protein [Microbacterium marinum]